jgi:hypothetical protein
MINREPVKFLAIGPLAASLGVNTEAAVHAAEIHTDSGSDPC